VVRFSGAKLILPDSMRVAIIYLPAIVREDTATTDANGSCWTLLRGDMAVAALFGAHKEVSYDNQEIFRVRRKAPNLPTGAHWRAALPRCCRGIIMRRVKDKELDNLIGCSVSSDSYHAWKCFQRVERIVVKILKDGI